VNSFNQSWPSFLDKLESHPHEAASEFYSIASQSLKISPPKCIRHLSETDQEVLIGKLIDHCVASEFHVLKKYINKGRPFAAWLHVVAHNFCVDRLRVDGKAAARYKQHVTSRYDQLIKDSFDSDQMSYSEFQMAVNQQISKLDMYCQKLLKMAAEEYTPREMVHVLGLNPEDNKKVSEDLRACRAKLRKLLFRAGIDFEELLK